MAQNQIPDAATVRQLLEYDPITGALTWNARGVHWFEACKRLSAEQKCSAWNARNAGRKAFTASDGKGYLQGQVAKYHTMAHRIIWVIVHGYWPDLIDHIDGDGMCNKLCNLRAVSQSENSRNSSTPKSNTSGHIGVRYVSRAKRWEAYIMDHRKSKYIGMYATMGEAIDARKIAERELGYHPYHTARPLASNVTRSA